MKTNVGMIYPVAAVISAYTEGSAITYNTGFVVDEARAATVSFEASDGSFYGDDVELDTDRDIIGYTIDFESTGLKDGVREKLLGEVKESSVYHVTGAPKPDVGFGYIKKMRESSGGAVSVVYEAWWFHKVKFAQPDENAQTAERSREWRTPTLNGRGAGVYLSSSDNYPRFAKHEDFTTLAAAKTWLQSLANIGGTTT